MTAGRRSDPILITGCSTGIGRAAALRLAAAGHAIWATARRPETLAELSAAGCETRRLDVTDDASARDVVDEIEQRHGAVGTLINNAGFGAYGAIESVAIEQWESQFATNVFGAVRVSQLVLPGMRRAGTGRIVNISSMGGRLTLPGGGAYHASKYALESLSDALRFEVRGFGIAVSLVEPGPVRSDFVDEATEPAPAVEPYAEFSRAVAARNRDAYHPRSSSSVDDVARVIHRAVTARRPRARYLTGSTARTLVAARAILPDRAWDALLRTQLPTPRTGGGSAARSR